MKLEDFPEIKFITSIQEEMNRCMSVYRRDHPQFRCFDFPEHFYFKIYNDRLVIHWAVIIKEETWRVYFINMRGRAFDMLEFKTKKQAQRALRRNKFSFSTNKYCAYKPISPVYINIGNGKKSAPYSKGKLWDFGRLVKCATAEKVKSTRKPINYLKLLLGLLQWVVMVLIIRAIHH